MKQLGHTIAIVGLLAMTVIQSIRVGKLENNQRVLLGAEKALLEGDKVNKEAINALIEHSKIVDKFINQQYNLK